MLARMTTILSASMMVLRRCATMMVVRSLRIAPSASCAHPTPPPSHMTILAVSRADRVLLYTTIHEDQLVSRADSA